MNSNVGRLITILLKLLTYLVNFCYLRYDIELVRLLALCTMGKNVISLFIIFRYHFLYFYKIIDFCFHPPPPPAPLYL
jgi:hypothetical protein